MQLPGMKTSLILLAICMTPLQAIAQIDTSSQPASFQSNITITGLQEGPYNLRVRVEDKPQPVPLTDVGKKPVAQESKPANQTATNSPSLPAKSPVNLGSLFPNLFGDESHHHGPDGKDVPFLSLPSHPPLNGHTPSIDFPYELPPRYDDSDYHCYNYVWEQLTGSRSHRPMNADDVVNLLDSFKRQTYKPGSQLPENYPPGTILVFAGHIGIVGSDGHTIFNYTKKAPAHNVPALLHKSPSANALWNHTDPEPPSSQPTNLPSPDIYEALIGPEKEPSKAGVNNQPYVGSPVQVFTPPQR